MAAAPRRLGQIRARWRIATDPRRTADEYAVWLNQLLMLEGYAMADVDAVIVATVTHPYQTPAAAPSLEARSDRQIPFSTEQAGDHTHQLDAGVKGKNFWVTVGDLLRAREWVGQGFTSALKTPDNTLVFVTPEEKGVIRKDQADCMGCLSQCSFSSWADTETNSTGRLADPRSFCIQKTLQDIAHGGDPDDNLAFAGHAAYRFKQDPFYSNNFTPTVKELVDRILTGD